MDDLGIELRVRARVTVTVGEGCGKGNGPRASDLSVWLGYE